MSLSRFVVAGLLVTALAAVAGCSTEGSTEEKQVASSDSELKLTGTRYIGAIRNGQTRTGHYSTPPNYRAYGFDAKGGDEITIDVKSVYGDAMGWITNTSYNVLASNDDASGETLDSRVTYKVPLGQSSRAYRIVFRDYEMLDATFDVTLSITSTTSSTCTSNGQTYQAGDQFSSSDGCNTCSCSASGSVSCTKLACTCDPANEPDRNYIGTPQQCMLIRYSCSAGQTPFSNSCGCGCELN